MMASQCQGYDGWAGEDDACRLLWRRRRVLVSILALLACSISPAWADAVPGDPDAFTAYVADRIRVLVPGTPVTVIAPLGLDVGDSGSGERLYLQRVFDVCQRDPDHATEVVDTFIKQMTAVERAPQSEATRETLRVIVRPEVYVRSEFETLAGRATPVALPLAGDLWLLAAADLPTAIKMVDSRDIAALRLSASEALARGKQNMLSELEQMLVQAHAARVPGVNLITGDPYTSSLLAFPDLWAPLAKASIGDLLVAVPAADVMLFTDTRESGALAALRDAVQTVMSRADRPLTTTIFRWSPAGWVVVP